MQHKVTLRVGFILNKVYAGHASLATTLPFVPTTGILLHHPVWKRARLPISVTYEFEGDNFDVAIGDEVVDSLEERDGLAEMYGGHGWTVRVPVR